jgi:hypothetical protein
MPGGYHDRGPLVPNTVTYGPRSWLPVFLGTHWYPEGNGTPVARPAQLQSRGLRSHTSHSRWPCMRADHFADRLVQVWGCGTHTKLLIMSESATPPPGNPGKPDAAARDAAIR